jgi:hypothetical protein
MTEKDELDLLLDQWNNTPANDPNIKHRVWMRIAGEYSRSRVNFLRPLETFFAFLSKPLGATTFIAATVVCGLVIAELRVSKLKNAQTEEFAKSYIQLIDSRTNSLNDGGRQ